MSRHHSHRPIPAKRMYVEPHYPTRESDGDEWHVGTMTDLRQLRIAQARQDALRYLALARMARLDAKWGFYMNRAAQSRAMFAGLLRSGGRVDWRGEPINIAGRDGILPDVWYTLKDVEPVQEVSHG